MGLFDDDLPQEPIARDDLSYGAPAGDLELLLLNFRKGKLSQRSDAARNAMQAATDERKAAIEKVTGKPFAEAVSPYMSNAMRNVWGPVGADGTIDFQPGPAPEQLAADALVEELQAGGTGVGILRGPEIRARARELAMQSVVDAQDADARDRTGLSGTLARFVGEAGNSMADPAILALLPLGLATDGLGVLPFLAAEGALGGAGSAMSLPAIAAWQKEIGLPEMTAGDMAGQIAFDAAISAGTAGLLRGAGHAFSNMVTPRQAVLAFDRAFPNGKDVTPELQARRDILESLADMADDNPLGNTPAQEAEHFKRVADVMAALDEGKPLPKFPEDAQQIPPAIPDNATAVVDAGLPPEKLAQDIADETPAVLIKERKRGALNRPLNVLEFIAKKGGLRDDGGELTNRGINTRSSMTYHGPWFRRKGEAIDGDVFGGKARTTGKGKSPDEMLELLRDNGFLREVAYDAGPVKLTPDDMYALIDEQLSGRKVVAADDVETQFNLDQTAKDKQNEEIVRERWEPAFGKDWRLPETYGEDFAREAQKARRDGVKWDSDDLDWAQQFQKDHPQETMRTAIAEAMVQKHFRLLDAADELARQADLAPSPDFDDAVNSLPVETDATGKIITFGELGKSRKDFPDESRQDIRPGGEGAVSGQRGVGGSDAEVPPAGNQNTPDLELPPDVATARQLFDRVPEPDDFNAVQKEIADMEAELTARFDDGADLDVSEIDPNFTSAKDLMDDMAADAEFLDAVKVCLE